MRRNNERHDNNTKPQVRPSLSLRAKTMTSEEHHSPTRASTSDPVVRSRSREMPRYECIRLTCYSSVSVHYNCTQCNFTTTAAMFDTQGQCHHHQHQRRHHHQPPHRQSSVFRGGSSGSYAASKLSTIPFPTLPVDPRKPGDLHKFPFSWHSRTSVRRFVNHIRWWWQRKNRVSVTET